MVAIPITYYASQISPHIDLTPEGFLICRDVPINRIGDQEYLAGELQIDGDPNRLVQEHRYPEDVFSPAALASFEAKDVTCLLYTSGLTTCLNCPPSIAQRAKRWS